MINVYMKQCAAVARAAIIEGAKKWEGKPAHYKRTADTISALGLAALDGAGVNVVYHYESYTAARVEIVPVYQCDTYHAAPAVFYLPVTGSPLVLCVPDDEQRDEVLDMTPEQVGELAASYVATYKEINKAREDYEAEQKARLAPYRALGMADDMERAARRCII